MALNNTWELSTVPYLPVMDLVARHCHDLASAGVNGMMMSWSLGGYPSPNLEIAARFRAQPTPGVDDVLDALAAEHYGIEGAPLARKAWTAFSTAFQQYPFACQVLYECPVHVGPANLLYREKIGYAATMTGIPYDDLKSWRGPYPADILATQFEKVAQGWQAGTADLEAAVRKAPAERRDEAQAELRFARVAAIHFQSVVNQVRYVAARDALADRSKALFGPAAAAPAGGRAEQPEIRDRLGAPVVPAGAGGFADRLRGRQSVFLRPAGPGGESDQLPLAAGRV